MLLDDLAHLRYLAPAAMNDRDGAENTPLDIAYRLGRTAWIERLEALGAEGDKTLLDWKGLGSFLSGQLFPFAWQARHHKNACQALSARP